MKSKNKLYGWLLAVSLTVFILEVFVSQKPDGTLGLVICLLSIYLMLGSIIKLCKNSEKFKDAFFTFLDLLFWLP